MRSGKPRKSLQEWVKEPIPPPPIVLFYMKESDKHKKLAEEAIARQDHVVFMHNAKEYHRYNSDLMKMGYDYYE